MIADTKAYLKKIVKLTSSSFNLLWTPAAKQITREQFSKVSRRTRLATGTRRRCLALHLTPAQDALSLQTTFLATHRRFL